MVEWNDPNAEEARKMTDPELTEKLCAYYNELKGRQPSLERKETIAGLARLFLSYKIPHWADVKRYIENTDMDELPPPCG